MALKDMFGNPVTVGSTVAFASRNGTRALLRKGVVTGTSEGTSTPGALKQNFVFIRTEADKDTSRDPEQVAVVEMSKAGGPSKGKGTKA